MCVNIQYINDSNKTRNIACVPGMMQPCNWKAQKAPSWWYSFVYKHKNEAESTCEEWRRCAACADCIKTSCRNRITGSMPVTLERNVTVLPTDAPHPQLLSTFSLEWRDWKCFFTLLLSPIEEVSEASTHDFFFPSHQQCEKCTIISDMVYAQSWRRRKDARS